jgi:Immunoglobulin domain
MARNRSEMASVRSILLKVACVHCLLISMLAQAQPIITSQPTNQTVEAGRSVTFAVTATGSPPLSYQWLFNDTPILRATNSTLTLFNVRSTNAGAVLPDGKMLFAGNSNDF